jgi:hypothetical protein
MSTVLGPIEQVDYPRLQQGMTALQMKVARFTAVGVV